MNLIILELARICNAAGITWDVVIESDGTMRFNAYPDKPADTVRSGDER